MTFIGAGSVTDRQEQGSFIPPLTSFVLFDKLLIPRGFLSLVYKWASTAYLIRVRVLRNTTRKRQQAMNNNTL